MLTENQATSGKSCALTIDIQHLLWNGWASNSHTFLVIVVHRYVSTKFKASTPSYFEKIRGTARTDGWGETVKHLMRQLRRAGPHINDYFGDELIRGIHHAFDGYMSLIQTAM